MTNSKIYWEGFDLGYDDCILGKNFNLNLLDEQGYIDGWDFCLKETKEPGMLKCDCFDEYNSYTDDDDGGDNEEKAYIRGILDTLDGIVAFLENKLHE